MTASQLCNLWDSFLREQLHCVPDANGNRPCDNGCACDKCVTKQAEEDWKEYLRR